jgi:hypothetical protein
MAERKSTSSLIGLLATARRERDEARQTTPSATRESVLDEAAKVVCRMCRDGRWPVRFGQVFTSAPSIPPEWFHLEERGAIGGKSDLAHPCDAAVIHALKQRPYVPERS